MSIRCQDYFVVKVRKQGTPNTWVNWNSPRLTLEEAIHDLRDAFCHESQAKLVKTTTVVRD